MRTRPTRIPAMIAALAVTLAACTGGGGLPEPDGPTIVTTRENPNRPTGIAASYSLTPFDACDNFLEYVISHAVELVGPYGLEDPGFYPWPVFAAEEMTADMAIEGAPSRAGVDFSGTNVQVLGVDEPDMVKTDGKRIVVLVDGELIVADSTGSMPKVVGRLDVHELAVQSLFLWNDTVLLFGSQWSTYYPLAEGDLAREFAPQYQAPTIELVEVDISDDPEIVRTMTIDGRYVSARMVGDIVRLVQTSGPVGFEWSYPKGTGLRAEREAIEENRDIIRYSSPDNWIPYYVVTDARGRVTSEGTLFDCERSSHPEEFSGLNMLSVTTIDLSNGLEVVDSTGVLANGETIYASEDSLYVATQNWQLWRWAQTGAEEDEPETVSTDIHKFDISKTYRTDYVASGRIQGHLLNQFSMDERDGLLRVASTTSPNWWWGSGPDSESRITVLQEDAGELKEIGLVDGLGETEQIYSVRFMGDVAYVVTFRQTDPLYTVDLSDPRNPEVAGELKILGYSAYLHPLGDGLLLGVGQDATDTGQIEGTQVSLFDVSDPADPTREDTYTLSEGSSSQVEYDHHAFLYWEPTGLAMVPVQQWWQDGGKDEAFSGAVGLEIDGSNLRLIHRVAHPGGDEGWDYRAQILRSVVIGDSVYTISTSGIMRSSLDGLDEVAWLDF